MLDGLAPACARVRPPGIHDPDPNRATNSSTDPYDPAPMRSPRSFFQPLAIGAPEPLTEIPVRPSRMIHFLDFSNEKMVAKAAEIATKADILLGNLEDAIPVDRKTAAREGLIEVGRTIELGETQLWTRVNALESPWVLDDLTEIVTSIGDRLDVVMVPKVEGPWDIHYVDRLLAQLEARNHLQRPILVHAILETAQGVANVEEIATASPRMQGMSLGPADLAASRRMKTTRVGGGHPGYVVLADPGDGERAAAQQDLWHYTLGRMVDACAAAGILPFYGPFGDIRDVEGCEAQFRAAYLMGCVGAWSLHPAQIDVARRVFSPDPDEVAFAKRVIEAIPGGAGVHMIDGKMQDDATWKQCRVMVDLAEMLARKDPELAEAYEL
jgi:malyl-CoA/(S)-citramalyl-CoA lyase